MMAITELKPLVLALSDEEEEEELEGGGAVPFPETDPVADPNEDGDGFGLDDPSLIENPGEEEF